MFRGRAGACVTNTAFLFFHENEKGGGERRTEMIDGARVRTTGYHKYGRNPIAEGRLIIACVIVTNVYGGSSTHARFCRPSGLPRPSSRAKVLAVLRLIDRSIPRSPACPKGGSRLVRLAKGNRNTGLLIFLQSIFGIYKRLYTVVPGDTEIHAEISYKQWTVYIGERQ